MYYGRVVIIGRTNVGKSTLLNQLINKKISIVSHKINTTRSNIIGIYHKHNYQIEYTDTPGITYSTNYKYFIQLFKNNKNDFNYILLMLDRNKWDLIEDNIVNIIRHTNIPTIIIINKMDIINHKKILLPYIRYIQQKIIFTELFIISARKFLYVSYINRFLRNNIPQKEHFYSYNIITNQNNVLIIIEIIRESLLFYLHKEIPYKINISLNNIININKNIFHKITAILFIQKNTHKKIIIGHHGQKIKLIILRSQNNICMYFNKKVIVHLYVKHK
ncbi:GTPase Era [Enterobacteriaceae endosymbiont of Macroplea appendiculata]|uniref:GTPase Era n=1 Tax=Enterobacteriaceae endosymbiont of Macroplea appendiculata TaxID=2675790 RepID=UPI001449C938|nr:GTPase Era [Enterobacteriaceae endosymbiont of Macroplea appendiculata]QJC30789.1 GTPase Era [Enterobacteriaceae endosymbiont of Macroplea appendiculata]